jgi:hypothetical protein
MASSKTPIIAAIVATALLAGCGHGKPHPAASSGLFDNQQQATITCMAHQTQRPGVLYTGGANGADTAHILQMMQYYTSNGKRTYCDGAKPTAIDQAWARLYLTLGGTTDAVRSALGGA